MAFCFVGLFLFILFWCYCFYWFVFFCLVSLILSHTQLYTNSTHINLRIYSWLRICMITPNGLSIPYGMLDSNCGQPWTRQASHLLYCSSSLIFFLIYFVIYFLVSGPQPAIISGLIPVRISTIWDPSNRTQVSRMLGEHFICCTISPAVLSLHAPSVIFELLNVFSFWWHFIK